MENKSQQPITLTTSQQNVLDQMKQFVFNSDDRVFILKGYAGTGKTTLMKFFIEHLKERNKSFRLLSPTGRGAKVIGDKCQEPASTIHSLIYARPVLNKDLSDIEVSELNMDKTGQLYLNFEPVALDEEKTAPTIYVVDEASMVADIEKKQISQAKFGTGKLLTELLAYDTRSESKFVFVGDPCQLPPIQEIQSPALSKEYFEQQLHQKVQECTLTEIFRQDNHSDIIPISQYIRKLCNSAPLYESYYGSRNFWQNIPLSQCRETIIYPDLDTMVDQYVQIVKENGYDNAIFVTPINRKCLEFSRVIRQKLGFSGMLPQKGDLLMVVQNNAPTGFMNGDFVEVISVNEREMIHRAQLAFVPVRVKGLFEKHSVPTLLLVDLLNSGTPNLDEVQCTNLQIDFAIRMRNQHITQKSDFELYMEKMAKDPYLNALRCNYGYAVTGHKAQGGEWEHVFVDLSNKLLNPTKEKYQWIYTAITRTRANLHLIDRFYIH